MQINRNITNPCSEIPLVYSGLFATKEELDTVRKRSKIENRDGKIETIINGIDFTEKKLEEDEEYKNLIRKGVCSLGPITFYIDHISLLKSER